MAGFDDMIKGMQMLQDGIATYQTRQAVNAAADQLAAANKGLADDKVKFDNAQAIGQDLALRLSGIHGMTQDKIAGAVSGILPSASSQGQIMGQERMQQAELKQKSYEAFQERQLKRDLFGMKNNAAEDKKTQADMLKFGKEFGEQKHIKPILEGLPRIDKAIDAIKSNRGQEGVTAAVELAKLGLIRDAAGRVNEQEIKGANESPSIRANLWKRAGLEITGETPLNVQDFWLKYLGQAKGLAQRQLKESVRGFATSKNIMNPKFDANKIEQGLRAQYGLKNPNQAKIDAAEAALADPANANDPQRGALETQLQKWKAEE